MLSSLDWDNCPRKCSWSFLPNLLLYTYVQGNSSPSGSGRGAGRYGSEISLNVTLFSKMKQLFAIGYYIVHLHCSIHCGKCSLEYIQIFWIHAWNISMHTFRYFFVISLRALRSWLNAMTHLCIKGQTAWSKEILYGDIDGNDDHDLLALARDIVLTHLSGLRLPKFTFFAPVLVSSSSIAFWNYFIAGLWPWSGPWDAQLQPLAAPNMGRSSKHTNSRTLDLTQGLLISLHFTTGLHIQK